MSRIIGVVGSRRRNTKEDFDACDKAISDNLRRGEKRGDRDQLVSGGCHLGADRFAEIIAKRDGLSITIHYADWEGTGRGAGFVRNGLIARDCDILIALPAPDRTGGTEDTIRKAERLGKPVILV